MFHVKLHCEFTCFLAKLHSSKPLSLTHTHTLFHLDHINHTLQSFFGLGQSAEIKIDLDEVEKRKKVDVKNEEGKKEKLPLYLDGESVTGQVYKLLVA